MGSASSEKKEGLYPERKQPSGAEEGGKAGGAKGRGGGGLGSSQQTSRPWSRICRSQRLPQSLQKLRPRWARPRSRSGPQGSRSTPLSLWQCVMMNRHHGTRRTLHSTWGLKLNGGHSKSQEDEKEQWLGTAGQSCAGYLAASPASEHLMNHNTRLTSL